MERTESAARREPWNKGKIVGQKAPLKLKDIWALRARLQMANRVRELALFNLGIDPDAVPQTLLRLESGQFRGRISGGFHAAQE